jgi:hypothetical protein
LLLGALAARTVKGDADLRDLAVLLVDNEGRRFCVVGNSLHDCGHATREHLLWLQLTLQGLQHIVLGRLLVAIVLLCLALAVRVWVLVFFFCFFFLVQLEQPGVSCSACTL